LIQAASISGTTVSDYKKTRCHSLKHHNRIQYANSFQQIRPHWMIVMQRVAPTSRTCRM